jgi:hypothetical protein
MHTLQHVIRAVDHLSPEERAELRQYLDEYPPVQEPLQAGTMDIDSLLAAAQAIRESMSPEDYEEMLAAMNEEYIEPVDENGESVI